MGNMMNTLDKNNCQLNWLGIKTIVYLTPGKFDHLEENPNYKCFHFETKEHEKPIIEIDQISELIITEMKSGPVFVFDVSGILSAAICLKVILDTNRAWTKEIGMAFIINKRYEAKDMPAWLY